MRAALSYLRCDVTLGYWRSLSQLEVDFVVSRRTRPLLAVEVKATGADSGRDLRGIRALGPVRQFSMSADGRRVALDAVSRISHIQRVAIDPVTGAPTSAPQPVTTGTLAYGGPAVSPDGARLAYVSEDFHEDLYVSRADGSDARALSTGESYTRAPCWSPDGAVIAFYGRRNGKLGIWTVDPDGRDLRWLSAELGSKDLWAPRWSPDGTRMAVSVENTQPLIIDLAGSWAAQAQAQHRVENAGWIATSWSPDGRWVAVSTGDGRIGRMDATTFQIEELLDHGYYPLWLADSRHLMIGEKSRLLVLDTVTREQRDVLSIAPGGIPLTPSMALSPDGREVYFTTERSDGDIWLLDLAIE